MLLHLRQNTGYMDGTWDFAGSGHVMKTQRPVRPWPVNAGRSWNMRRSADAEFVHLCHRVAGGDGTHLLRPVLRDSEIRRRSRRHGAEKNAGLHWFPVNALPEHISSAVEAMLPSCLNGIPYGEYINDKPVKL